MSLEKGFSWNYGQEQFKGYSIAGQCTSIFYNNAKICFDIAQGLPFQLNAQLYCLSHLHADHGSGLNYLLSQRSLYRLPKVSVLLPERHCDKMENILQQWQSIEEFQYQYELVPVRPGMIYDHSEHYKVGCFQTTHRIDSVGYIVYKCKKKLSPLYAHKTRDEIIKLKTTGIDIEETVLHPIFAFTGDTQIEFLKAHSDISRCEFIFMECTSLDKKKTREEIRAWGHLHWDEVLDNLPLFTQNKICLIHLSARYTTSEAQKILQETLPIERRDQFEIFPRPY